MNTNDDAHLPPELAPVGERLRAARATATPLELDRIKRDVMTRASRKGTPRMKSRMTITSMLVAGVLMSTTGAGLALTGGGNASVAQYGGNLPAQNTGNGTQVLGALGQNGKGTKSAPSTTQNAPVAQVTRQVAAPSNGQLPFTGFMTIGILIVGLFVLATGLVMRYKTRARPID